MEKAKVGDNAYLRLVGCSTTKYEQISVQSSQNKFQNVIQCPEFTDSIFFLT